MRLHSESHIWPAEENDFEGDPRLLTRPDWSKTQTELFAGSVMVVSENCRHDESFREKEQRVRQSTRKQDALRQMVVFQGLGSGFRSYKGAQTLTAKKNTPNCQTLRRSSSSLGTQGCLWMADRQACCSSCCILALSPSHP
eukprot:2831291-Rhodomonas_salina.1